MADNMTYKSKKARDKAREHFGLGVGDDDFVLHHVDTTLKYTNPERYNEWRPEDLVVMKRSEHISLHHKGVSKVPWNKGKTTHMKGRPHSPEHVRKIAEANKRPVEQCTLAGELVRVWESALQAEVEGGFCRGKICMVCKGKRPHHKKYIWKYSQRKK